MPSYTKETKNKVLDLCKNGNSVNAASKVTRIPRTTIYRWIKEAREMQEPTSKRSKMSVQKLKAKMLRQQEIIRILQTIGCSPTSPLKEKLHAMAPYYGHFNISYSMRSNERVTRQFLQPYFSE